MLGNLLDMGLGPFKVKIWFGLAAFLAMVAFVVIKIADNRDERMIDTAKEGGAASAVIEGQNDTLSQVEKANEAERKIDRNGDSDRYARCLRNSTEASRANCARFKPVPD